MEFIEAGVGWSDEKDSFLAGKSAAEEALEQVDSRKLVASFIFSSTQYNLRKLLNGAKSVVGKVPQIGGTTGWVISGEELHEKSVVVAVMASDLLDFSVSVSEKASMNPVEAGRNAVKEALGGIRLNPYRDIKSSATLARHKPFIVLTVTDVVSSNPGTHSGGIADELILKSIHDHYGVGLPIIGGAAGEDGAHRFERAYQFCNWEVYSDSFVCGIIASKLKFGIGVRHGFKPIEGASAVITKAGRREIHQLNGKPADEVCASLCGVDTGELEERKPILGVYDHLGDFYWLKACFHVKNHSLVVNAPVKENTCISIMETTPVDQVKAAGNSLKEALADARGDAKKAAVIFIPNCTGRTAALGERAGEQLKEITKVVGKEAKVFGFHTYGEHAAPRGSICGFHNLTIPVLTILDEPIE